MCCLCLSLIFLFGSLFSQESKNERLIGEILDRKLVTVENSDKYTQILSLITKGSNFERKWQINQPLKEGYLNLYILRAGLRGSDLLPEGGAVLLDGCSYLGAKNIVVCDNGFIETFLAKRRVPEQLKGRPNEKLESEHHKESFILWVLGHELGHIMKGHGQAHFESDNLEKYVASSSLYERAELEADAFIIEQISKNSDLSLRLTRMVLDFLNAEIQKKIGSDQIPHGAGILYDYNNKKVVEYLRRSTHPEYVIRLTRILQQIGRIKGNEGLKNLADDFARHIREGY